MFSSKKAKRCARKSLKSHYGIFAIACVIAAFLGVAYGSSLSAIQLFSSSKIDVASVYAKTTVGGMYSVIDSLLSGDIIEAENEVEENESEEQVKTVLGAKIEYEHGAFAFIASSISSGSYLVTIYLAIAKIVGSNDAAYIIFALLIIAVVFLVWMFFVNTYKVVYKRIFLEGRIYKKVPIRRFLYLIKIKRLTKAAKTMLTVSVYQILWYLTIAGGVIKRYSYFLTPYIAAENPSIPPKEAIELSRLLMKGHKWECFLLELSFLGWQILGILTFGLLSVFYVNPYKEAVFSEYYVYLRQLALKAGVKNTEKLNDAYLYKRANKEKIRKAYADIDALARKSAPVFAQRKGFWKIMADFFGVVPAYDRCEKDYVEYQERKLKVNSYKMYLEGSAYPTRLYPVEEKEKSGRLEELHYTRHYSVCSLVLIFFIICIIGFLWEISLNFVINGSFAKKGILHGPWLPIYGFGSVLILTLLNKLRTKPALEFSVSVVLCGFVEYFTSLALERIYGKMWWDYSGYFINFQGRVCAEGLLVFGLGGMAVVYLAAPSLDNLIRKIPRKIAVPLCLALLAAFSCDVAYSASHPNTGRGVTDYSSSSYSSELAAAQTQN